MIKVDKCDDCIHNEICLLKPCFNEYATVTESYIKDVNSFEYMKNFATLIKCKYFEKDHFVEMIEQWETERENDEFEDEIIPLG